MVHRCPSCGTRAQGRVGSVVGAHGLSCLVACGILVPRPGIESVFSASKGKFFTMEPSGKSQVFSFDIVL